MNTVEEFVTALEPRDKRALLHASRVGFYRDRDGQGYIKAIRDGAGTQTGYDEEHRIFTRSSVTDYGRGYFPDQTYDCYHLEYSVDAMLRTIIRSIKTGDRIHLQWVRDNNNELNREIGWHRDELRLILEHSPKDVETYLIEVKVGPDNLARMVRA